MIIRDLCIRTQRLRAALAIIPTFAVMLAVVIAAQPPAAQAQQDSFFNRQQFLEEDIRRAIEADTPDPQRARLTYGGYVIPQWQEYEGTAGSEDNLRQVDLRLWFDLNFDGVHRVYARTRVAWTNFGPGDSPFSWNQDLLGPNLDRGFYEIRLSEALRRAGWADWPFASTITAGRQFVEFGNGLALSEVLDGATVRLDFPDWRFTGLAGRTILSRDNIDRSPVVADHMDRVFGGLQVDYLGLSRHQLFAYWFSQYDRTGERPRDPLQDYEYDSHYFGMGARGDIIQNLRYASELVFQTGHSQNAGVVGGSAAIRAMAFDQVFEYYFQHPSDPIISLQYAVATGDDDRLSANSSLFGNTAGNDNAFQGFGYINTGYSFAPAFTNLQFLRLGGRFKPMPESECFKQLEIGTDFYWFWKQQKNGPISDFRANRPAHELGTEVDLYLNWRIFSDLAVTLRYGRFWTGDAFANSEKRDFVYAGFIYSF